MKKRPVYIMGGISSIAAKLATALSVSHHPVVVEYAKMQEEELIEKRKRELQEENAKVNGRRITRIDAQELRQQLGEITLRTKKFHEKPDSIPCPKPYRRRR